MSNSSGSRGGREGDDLVGRSDHLAWMRERVCESVDEWSQEEDDDDDDESHPGTRPIKYEERVPCLAPGHVVLLGCYMPNRQMRGRILA